MTSTRWVADLHLHTHASDGTMTPGEVIQGALDCGVNLVAITDHDTLDGLAEACAAAKRTAILFLGGIELSVGHGQEIHLLGYGVSPADQQLQAFLQTQMARRRDRMHAIIDRLRALGMPLEPRDASGGDDRFMGRMHLGYAMASHGYVTDANEAFDRWLNPGKPAYVSGERVSVAEGIRILRAAGAITVLAHPGRSHLDAGTLSMLLPEWLQAGLHGIEAYHASHSDAQCRQYDRMARAHGLLVTGGSDSHGRPDGPKIGDHLQGWKSMQTDVPALLARLKTMDAHN